MPAHEADLERFKGYDAQVLGISVDSVPCNTAWAKSLGGLTYDLLSDFEPKGAVSRLYGADRQDDGYSERALFVVDGDGIIRWSYCSPVGVNPGADGILEALESLASESVPARGASLRVGSPEARL